MVKIALPGDTTTHRVYAKYKSMPQEERAYLGASVIGNECRRALWYAFRWANPPQEHLPRIMRLFDTGQREEQRIIEDLTAGGVTLLSTQAGFCELGGHFRGHIDGLVGGLPEAPKTLHILEVKTHNDKSFKALLVDGVKKSKPAHYAQIQIYMHYFGYERALYVAVNKNDDNIFVDRVAYNKKEAKQLADLAEAIIRAPAPPYKLHDDPSKPTAYVCGWCPSRGVCHESLPARRNCRTCINSTAVLDDSKDGKWRCDFWGKDLTLDEQRAGCPKHRYIPDLVAGRQVDADPEARTVTYAMASGEEWVDGS
jgi:hypothetical protein